MSQKEFYCKNEEVPAISGEVTSNYERDFAEYSEFSSEFTLQSAEELKQKRAHCLTMVKTKEVTEQMKSLTEQLPKTIKAIRLSINKAEGYLLLAEKSLDLPVSGFSISELRTELSVKNIPAIVLQGNTLYTKLMRNQAVLASKGMSDEFLALYKSQIDELDTLKITQKNKMSERAQTTDSNTKDFNELWEMTTKILVAAQAMYRGVNDLKLKDYTISHLRKQLRAKGTDSKDAGANPAGE